MNLATIIAAIREFFLEFLGYLLPGAAFLLLIYFFLSEETINTIFIPEETAANTMRYRLLYENYLYIFLTMAYLSGYMLYGIGKLKTSLSTICNFIIKSFQRLLFGKKALSPFWKRVFRNLYILENKRLEQSIIKSEEFDMSCQILRKLLHIPPEEAFPKSLNKFAVVRNLALSYVPEADLKIATFTFRAELAEHISAMALLIGLTGLVCQFIPEGQFAIFARGEIYTYLYLILLLCAYFLHQTYIRMLWISKKIVFPILISKYYRMHSELLSTNSTDHLVDLD